MALKLLAGGPPVILFCRGAAAVRCRRRQSRGRCIGARRPAKVVATVDNQDVTTIARRLRGCARRLGGGR